jgi:hypothetical protein
MGAKAYDVHLGHCEWKIDRKALESKKGVFWRAKSNAVSLPFEN